MHSFSYEELVSRSYFFIDSVLQEKIKTTKLIFAGCGLASVMAEMAVRLGFQKFLLIDSDKVALSNLNRQAFQVSDIGEFKVKALQKKLLSINPNAEIDVLESGIRGIEDINNIIKQGDIIVNTIDCGNLYFNLVHIAMKSKKFVVCPFNPGFGGLAVCFNEHSGNLYDLLNTNKVESGLEFSRKLILNNPKIELPQDIRSNINILFNQILERGYEPQLAVGVNMSSAIGISCIIKYLNDEAIPYCPSIVYCGLYANFQ